MRWYVLHVLSGQELKVQRYHEKRTPELKTLVPCRIVNERKNGVQKTVKRILFPGYVFVQVDLTPESYYKAIAPEGVISFLGRPTPSPVPPHEMANVLRLCSESELVGTSKVTDGDKVKIISGPLKDFEGQIIKVDRRKGRARVRMTLFGQEKDVDFGIELLQAPE
ncbi:antiterminator LoaP [Paenibacillus sp. NPDC057967]|uniref:antiterminator LoaP n=1 Tax=Paenibacillus sp. NPDC057967 TaxID=3346293 RepID=UPI0036DD2992